MKCIEPSFRTTVPVAPYPKRPVKLQADERLLLMGSCFTDNIGTRLLGCGVPASVNPTGALYNPASIAMVLKAAMNGALPPESMFDFQERTRCWLFSTRFSHTDPQSATELFARTLDETRKALCEAQTLVFTFGTAWIYEHEPSALSNFAAIVSNCHKVPATEFIRRRLSVDDIVHEWIQLLTTIRKFRDNSEPLNVIFTVSPIRHFKDGAHENTISKATLHLAIEELMQSCGEEINVDYFPAWELIMDDLRDYRFYAEDMLHPSPTAIDYIWQRFMSAYFSAADIEALNVAERALRAASHKTLL